MATALARQDQPVDSFGRAAEQAIQPMVREARIEEGWDWQTERFAGLAVPRLLLTGSETRRSS